MTDRSEIVGIRLTPEEREEFDEFIREENEFDSLSRLFRVTAYRYMNSGDEEATVDQDEIIRAVDTSVTPLEERLDRIEEHVLSIDSSVTNDDKIDRLARDLYSSLPVHSTGNDLPDFDEVGQFDTPSDLALAQAISTPEVWAQYFDEDLADVRRACARMLEYYPDVGFVEDTTEEAEADIPRHDNLSIGESSSHTDSTSDSSPRVSVGDESLSAGSGEENQDKSTVRRYYKESGA
ncbi:hypothetical protein M0R88_06285 [Halorussus gelatinilyticus]|jgi:hypothetical protein|uniref:Uncharacterized protein n=1 Tax=Halorussus gelatinilyticus TaxID=2937524 RepID=A0A8U0ILZ7_9EURY|nr:hypothetical protein [Halorussus gelatinilyticus]UPW01706.1 hypothetical protein M0R88_06285 [Halorussus gelatinilyticus]